MILELSCGVITATGFILILEDDIVRNIFGIVLFSTAINLILLFCGGLEKNAPVFLDGRNLATVGNPLPQALILTAIVIGFGLLAFLCAMVKTLSRKKRRSLPDA